jgi:hypothetical protein
MLVASAIAVGGAESAVSAAPSDHKRYQSTSWFSIPFLIL